jgi:hypothetical protein
MHVEFISVIKERSDAFLVISDMGFLGSNVIRNVIIDMCQTLKFLDRDFPAVLRVPHVVIQRVT